MHTYTHRFKSHSCLLVVLHGRKATIYTHKHIHDTQTQTYTHTHTHTHIYIYIHIYTCIHIHTASSLTAASLSSFMARRHSLVCASPTEAMAIKDLIAASRTCHVCMYVCMHVCVHVCMYDCMYVCMYVCMHVCGNKLPCLLCA